jgi:hypothetical protein
MLQSDDLAKGRKFGRIGFLMAGQQLEKTLELT